MLDAGQSELLKSFRGLNEAAKAAALNAEHQLLLMFYAAECGLKYLILRYHAKASTMRWSQFPGATSLGHDLGSLVSVLKWGPIVVPKAPEFVVQASGVRHSPARAHEAWRYGITMTNQSQNELRNWLTLACEKIGKEI